MRSRKPPPDMRTQRYLADGIRADFMGLYPRLDAARHELKALLGKAQNGPPDGKADGSISEAQWRQLRSIADAADKLLALLFDSP